MLKRCPRKTNELSEALIDQVPFIKLYIIRNKKNEPNISKLFSGNRFPLATPSSIDDQIFFAAPSLLAGLLPFGPEFWLSIDARCPIPTILATPCQLIRSKLCEEPDCLGVEVEDGTRLVRQGKEAKPGPFAIFSSGGTK